MSSFRSLSRLAIATLFLAWSFPYLQGRLHVLSLLISNSPNKLPEVNKFSTSSLKFQNKIRNCEDGIIVDEGALAILSCDPGRDLWNTVMGTFHPDRDAIPNGKLWIYRYDLPEKSEKALVPVEFDLSAYEGKFSFHPLGVEYHRESGTLVVCNHHIDGSRIEVFTLTLNSKGAVAKHTRSIAHPLLSTPNSVVALNGNEFYITNDHYFRRRYYPALALAETYSGIPGGTVAYVNLAAEPVEVKTVARGPFVNGVTLLNESTVAVALSGAAEVRLYNRLEDNSLQQVDAIRLGFVPDNLSTDKDGSLLIAGHPHPPSLEKTVHARTECKGGDGVVPQECWKSTSPSWVERWTPARGLETLYVSSKEFGSSATAAKDVARNVGIVTGLYENGILVWKE
ncbi:uncharacterized protein APUU_40185A [Aspergillus puulaauensis]|uniref:Calcium-dependent phosphotriesterase n=1 Tax=Aspergillus puulaauensis TaxID=1220207 RepID=A0A7R8ALW7_9EURO|nr:uncharacterized protein APUU_40185A [Aspergillus puulaauensis]BCS23741.1 hypothetical protein APUU_40185A [Aspergillus puulaauensis]